MTVDFGTIAVGAWVTKPVDCVNTGVVVTGETVNLLVSSFQVSNPVFSVAVDARTPLTDAGVAPGQSVIFDVSYTTNAAGTDNGMLVIDSNGVAGKATSIALTGTTVDGGAIDPRCNQTNCEALAACPAVLEGTPRDPYRCGSFLSPAEYVEYCEEACQANDAGALLQCVATSFGSNCLLSDGGRATFNDVTAACDGDGGTPACGTNCMSCRLSCNRIWANCNLACPDAGVCFDCEYQCSQAFVGCNSGCPTD